MDRWCTETKLTQYSALVPKVQTPKVDENIKVTEESTFFFQYDTKFKLIWDNVPPPAFSERKKLIVVNKEKTTKDERINNDGASDQRNEYDSNEPQKSGKSVIGHTLDHGRSSPKHAQPTAAMYLVDEMAPYNKKDDSEMHGEECKSDFEYKSDFDDEQRHNA